MCPVNVFYYYEFPRMDINLFQDYSKSHKDWLDHLLFIYTFKVGYYSSQTNVNFFEKCIKSDNNFVDKWRSEWSV